jgi:GTPase SAR1 family protein
LVLIFLFIKRFLRDTAGQEKFRSLTSSYYRGAQGMIFGIFSRFVIYLVYDVCNIDSFQNIPIWLKEVEQNNSNSDMIKMLIGNKVDKV